MFKKLVWHHFTNSSSQNCWYHAGRIYSCCLHHIFTLSPKGCFRNRESSNQASIWSLPFWQAVHWVPVDFLWSQSSLTIFFWPLIVWSVGVSRVFPPVGCRSPLHPFGVELPTSHLGLIYKHSAGGILKPEQPATPCLFIMCLLVVTKQLSSEIVLSDFSSCNLVLPVYRGCRFPQIGLTWSELSFLCSGNIWLLFLPACLPSSLPLHTGYSGCWTASGYSYRLPLLSAFWTRTCKLGEQTHQ